MVVGWKCNDRNKMRVQAHLLEHVLTTITSHKPKQDAFFETCHPYNVNLCSECCVANGTDRARLSWMFSSYLAVSCLLDARRRMYSLVPSTQLLGIGWLPKGNESLSDSLFVGRPSALVHHQPPFDNATSKDATHYLKCGR